MKTYRFPLLLAALASGANAAETIAPPPAPTGQVLLLSQCPSERKVAAPQASAAILAALGLAVIKNLAVAAADAFASLIEKHNKNLSAVSGFEGFGWFYGPERINAAAEYQTASASTVAGCVVVMRYGNLPEDPAFTQALGSEGAQALAQIGVTAVYSNPQNAQSPIAAPDFYAELKLQQAQVAQTNGTAISYGFRLKPILVYYGRSAAKAGRDHKKALRLELSLYRYQLDKGQLSDKPYYTAGFDLDRQTPGTLLTIDGATKAQQLKVPAGPLASYPVPAEIKSGTLRLVTSGSVSSLTSVNDPAMFAGQAKLIESEDPSFLMKAIASAATDNKTKIEEAATSAALKAVQGFTQ